MDSVYGALAVVPLIVGPVEVAMRQGMPARWATPLAVALGVAISVGYTLAAGLPGGGGVADAVLRGLVLGLSAAGLNWSFRARFGDGEPAQERR